MAEVLTLTDALASAGEEVYVFHMNRGLPHSLTHHQSQHDVKHLTHEGDYDDKGNYAGSIVMMALLFADEALGCRSILPLLDGHGGRAAVLQEWGQEHQRSGVGQDNYRTNLLEALLQCMGRDGRNLQRAWRMMRKYSVLHANLSRRQLLAQALQDPRTDLLTEEDATMRRLVAASGDGWEDDTLVDQALLLVPEVRRTGRAPDYDVLCALTGCSSGNSARKQRLWALADSFARSDPLTIPAAARSDPPAKPFTVTEVADAATMRRLFAASGSGDDTLLDQALLLVAEVRRTGRAPDYDVLCALTSCSRRKSARKQRLWALADDFARSIWPIA